jgi:thioester reductase-like protein
VHQEIIDFISSTSGLASRPLRDFPESIDRLRPGFRRAIHASIAASMKRSDDRDTPTSSAKGYAESKLVAEELARRRGREEGEHRHCRRGGHACEEEVAS